jgi:coronin-1B/1C/6
VFRLFFHFFVSSNVIASGSQDNTVRMWDTIAQQDKIVLDPFKEAIYNLSWNWDGSLLAVSSKDRKLRILDPRQKTVAQVKNSMCIQFIHYH